MKQAMIAALFVVAASALGVTQAPRASSALEGPAQPAPAVALEADELQRGSCGDTRCQPPEDCHSCPQDCGGCCGNRRCEPPEDCNSCPQDCGDCCGNRRCEPPEDCNSCPADCC